MPLLELKTDLKSLRYGKDTLGGGYSGQPYIQTPIPESFNNIGDSEDFILRGGINAVEDSIIDVKRLGKMFTDTKSPNGLLFIAKQNLLSRTAVKTQTSGILNEGIYTPLTTLAEAGIVAFGGHLNKQTGIKNYSDVVNRNNQNYIPPTTTTEVNTNIINNDITGGFDIENIYSSVTKPNKQPNRLLGFWETFIISKNDSPNLRSYPGGPGSNLGIGNTNIKFADQRTGINNDEYGKKQIFSISIDKNGKQVGGLEVDPNKPWIKNELNELPSFNLNSSQTSSLSYTMNEVVYSQNTFVYNRKDIIDLIDNYETYNSSPRIQDFRSILRKKLGENTENGKNSSKSGATAYSLNYQEGSISQRVNLGDPGQRANKNYSDYSKGVINNEDKSVYGDILISGLGSYPSGLDRITSIPIYRSENVTTEKEVNDLVKFRIAIINNDDPKFKTFIHFRAFLDNFSDSYNATWNGFNYLGRGEQFFTYGGYSRQISLGWTIAAQSKQELIPMYKKLNYLASSLTPDYSPNGYMRGNLAQLTVGGYLYEQPGIITSITYEVPTESPWEIGIGTDFNYTGSTIQGDNNVKELPHIIKVTGFNFIPIQSFIPRLQKNWDNNTGFPTTYGPERYIALSNGIGSNYNNYDN